MWSERKVEIDSKNILNFLSFNSGIILDIGCGYGKHSVYFNNHGSCFSVGLDISLKVLKEIPLIEKIHCDACFLPFCNEKFDYVLCIEVVEHLREYKTLFREISRIMKKCGTVCFIIPCLNVPFKPLIKLFRFVSGIEPKKAAVHINVFSAIDIFNALNNEFKILDISYSRFIFPFVIEKRFGVGFELDKKISRVQKRIDFLHYFASTVWIKAMRRI